ncbi:MAG: YbjQ family protein [Pseudomonadota bacterium]
MIVVTTEDIPGYEIADTIGIVRGNVIRAKHVGTDIIASLRNLVGGEVSEYTKLMAEAREQAYDRMIADAKAQGADAVIGMRFATSMVTQGAAEMLAFGTGVKLKPSA